MASLRVEMLGGGSLDAVGEYLLSGLLPAPSTFSWVPLIRAQQVQLWWWPGQSLPRAPASLGRAAVDVSFPQGSDFMFKIYLNPHRNWSEVYFCTSQSTPSPNQSNPVQQAGRAAKR